MIYVSNGDKQTKRDQCEYYFMSNCFNRNSMFDFNFRAETIFEFGTHRALDIAP